MKLDVMSLFGHRGDWRWNIPSAGDVVARVTWSTPDKVAVVKWGDAYGTPNSSI